MTAPDVPPPAASTDIPFVTDAVRLVRVLFSPEDVFKEQQERPTFWRPWLILAVLMAVLQFIQRPYQARVQELVLAQRGVTAPPGAGAGAASLVIGSVTGALVFLIICALIGGILYLLVAGFGGETTYKKMLTVTVFAAPLSVLQQALVATVLRMRGVDAIRSVWDMIPALGADLLLPADAQVGAFLRIFLGQIGVLQIWGVVVTAVGLMVLARMGKGAAWAAAIISFLVGAALTSGMAAFGVKAAGG